MNADFSSYPSNLCKSASKNFFFPLKSEEPFFLTDSPIVVAFRYSYLNISGMKTEWMTSPQSEK